MVNYRIVEHTNLVRCDKQHVTNSSNDQCSISTIGEISEDPFK
jgi:hypothetical protein